MSREHYISENILEQIEFISSKGVPWLSHINGNIPINALVSKCLCQYHNSFLSELDALAGKVFTEIKQFDDKTPKRIIVPGTSFERFMLKIVFGMLSTGQYQIDGKKCCVNDLDVTWVDVLYGVSEFPKETGLYVFYSRGEKIKLENRFRSKLVHAASSISGLEMYMGGFTFLLSLRPKDLAFRREHPGYDSIIYHPKFFKSDTSLKEIEFVW